MEMRKLLLVVTLLLAGLTAACIGGNSKLPACPSPSAAAVATFVAPPTLAPPTATDVSSAVWDGSKLLQDHYVDALNRVTLLEAAWDGTRSELQKRGIAIPEAVDPDRAKASNSHDRETQLRTAFEKLAQALDSSKVTSRELTDIALSSMADSLNDGHTTYIPPAEWTDEQQNRITSVGLRLQPVANGYVVVDVLPGSPAESAGMKRGDVLTSFNGQSLAGGVNNPGPPPAGAFATVIYTRQGGPPQQLQIESEPVDLPPVHAELVNGDIGLLQMYTFPSTEGCAYLPAFKASLDSAISGLKGRGATAWILDLRSNPGGATETAASVSGSLGYKGLLAEVKRRGGHTETLDAKGASLIDGQPLAILVNEGSASSSEIVSGSMQQTKSANIIGETTAGEVAAAAEYAIAGGGMEITVGRVTIGPQRITVEGSGIMPDQHVDLDLGLLANQGRDSQVEAAVSYLESKQR